MKAVLRVVLPLSALVFVGVVASADWYTFHDCEATPCALDDGTLKLCANGGTQRIETHDGGGGLTFTNFIWNPGSLAQDRQLNVHFRWGEANTHKVTFDANLDTITLSSGLPATSVSYDFSLQDYFIEVVHGHRLLVYIEKIDPEHRVVDVTLPEADQPANQVAIEAVDDGTCHRFQDIEGINYRWDCVAGTCQLDDAGIELCGNGTHELEFTPATANGVYDFTWTPGATGVTTWKWHFRNDDASRHTVVFDVATSRIRFESGLTGVAIGRTFLAGETMVRITHGATLGVGTVNVYVDDFGEPPNATATYTATESANKFAVEAVNTTGGCQRLSQFDPP